MNNEQNAPTVPSAQIAANPMLNAGAIGKPYQIVCVQAYEFEGRQFVVGELSLHSWGINIPMNWRKATVEDIERYINRRR
jgi:hypothetical protein